MTIEIDHTSLSVADYEAAKKFYAAALKPLRIEVMMEFPASVTGNVDVCGLGADGKPFLWLSNAGKTTPHIHICFRAENAGAGRRILQGGDRGRRQGQRPAGPRDRSTTRITTAPSCSIPTGTISKPSATSPDRESAMSRSERDDTDRRLPVRRGALSRCMQIPTEPSHLPLPHVPEGLRLLLRAARRRAARQVRADARQARDLQELGSRRARLLPRLRHAAHPSVIYAEEPDRRLDRLARRAGIASSRSSRTASRAELPYFGELASCRKASPPRKTMPESGDGGASKQPSAPRPRHGRMAAETDEREHAPETSSMSKERLVSLRHHPARRRADQRRRLLARGQDPRRRHARPARRRLCRGRLSRRQPDRRRLLRREAHRARDLHRLRHDQAGRRQRRPTIPACGRSSMRRPTRSASSPRPGTIRSASPSASRTRRTSRHPPVGRPRRARPAGRCSSTASISSTATRPTRDYALACAKAAYDAGARWVVLCDTNGGTLPEEVEAIVARGRARRSRATISASMPITTRSRRSPIRSPRSAPARARSRARSTASASAAAMPISSRSSRR